MPTTDSYHLIVTTLTGTSPRIIEEALLSGLEDAGYGKPGIGFAVTAFRTNDYDGEEVT